ncbi:TetR/AcrR family transcriptional regulator [Halorubrum sp. BOL3-1]|uniref:TetR/AcrR family transcriptional regulator n=1 Tax=Halorubrum sp. BOL3-1 TaxID=2497325 RepID=UPI001004ED0F|nr:TetR/AcrR family transcriptional regulator [Halorubrum sp. BOL3-1]QAU12151.1 TetR/AcrR family transcriptional regulator [Halorubrum sp. BOL3-1]
MTRFSDEDRERIRGELIEAGRELFTRHGFERTRIKDVTEAVEIGTSTFYQFYDSKEMLYVAVLKQERDRLIDRVDAAVVNAETPREEVRTMLETLFDEVRSDPLISRMIVDNEFQTLLNQLSESERESLAAEPPGEPLGYADRWVQLPSFRFDDPDLVRDAITSLIFTTRSQELMRDPETAMEPQRVDQALIDTIVEGLFVNDTSTENAGEATSITH